MNKEQLRERFEKEFPRLIISINHSPWDRTERVEANGELMLTFLLSEVSKARQEGRNEGLRPISVIVHRYIGRDCDYGHTEYHEDCEKCEIQKAINRVCSDISSALLEKIKE